MARKTKAQKKKKKVKSSDVAKILNASRGRLLRHLRTVIDTHKFNYKTFGTEIESHLWEEVFKILREQKVVVSSKDFKIAANKNAFPDLLLPDVPMALDVKSGSRSKKSRGKWVACKNSANDLGTINSWETKINKFGGENIYFIFIEYDLNDQRSVLDVKTKPFYYFLRINPAGLLSYREKDGNLRPKNFDAAPQVRSLSTFQRLFKKTRVYRAKRIIKKHFRTLPKRQRKNLLEELNDIL